MRPSITALLLLVSGCGVPGAIQTTVDQNTAAIAALQADRQDVDQLREDLLSAKETIVELQASIQALQAMGDVRADLDVLTAHEHALAAEILDPGFSATDVRPDVAGFVDQLASSRLDASACASDCVTAADLTLAVSGVHVTTADEVASWLGFPASPVDLTLGDTYDAILALQAADTALAGEVAVIDAGYVRDADLDAYATTVALGLVSDRVSAVEVDYLRASNLSGYATEAWVAAGYPEAAELAAVAGRVSTIEGDYLQADDLATYATQPWVSANYPEQADLDVVEASLEDATAAIGDHGGRLDDAELDIADLRDDLGGYARFIASDRVIRVPSDQPTIQDALDSLQDAVIHASARVDILVEPAGCVAQAGPIVARHRDGARIHIRSESGDATQCVLTFPDVGVVEDNYGGVLVKQGYTLGELRGFTLRGPSGGVLPAGGLELDQRAALLGASDLVLEGWGQGPGVSVGDGSFFQGAGGLIAQNNGQSGFQVSGNSTAYMRDSAASQNGGSGFDVSDGGLAYVSGSWSVTNGHSGFSADRGALLVADFATTCGGGDCEDGNVSRGNDEEGFKVSRGSVAYAQSASAYGNGRSGFTLWMGSVLDAQSTWSVGNAGSGFYNGYNSTLSADAAHANENGSSGFQAYGAAVIRAVGSLSMDNGVYGYGSFDRSWLEAGNATANDNGYFAFDVGRGGYVYGVGAVAGGNGSGENGITPNGGTPDASFIER